MVDQAVAAAMLTCATSSPAEVDELALAGLTPIAALQINAARVAENPRAMEYRIEQIIDYPGRAIVLGRVVQIHVRDNCIVAAGRYVMPDQYQPITRLHADNSSGQPNSSG